MKILKSQLSFSICYKDLMKEFFPEKFKGLKKKGGPQELPQVLRRQGTERTTEKSSTFVLTNEQISRINLLKKGTTTSRSFLATNYDTNSNESNSPLLENFPVLQNQFQPRKESPFKREETPKMIESIGSIEAVLEDEEEVGELPAAAVKRRKPIIEMSPEHSKFLFKRQEFSNSTAF